MRDMYYACLEICKHPLQNEIFFSLIAFNPLKLFFEIMGTNTFITKGLPIVVVYSFTLHGVRRIPDVVFLSHTHVGGDYWQKDLQVQMFTFVLELML